MDSKSDSYSGLNYSRIAEAIEYIQQNFNRQPGLDEIAEEVHVSPYHFHRLFTDWAGISPRKFLQYITAGYAKKILTENASATLFDVANETGLSSTSRLHDLFIKIDGMTPAEYKKGGQNLCIQYSFAETQFGTIIAASTKKGICHLAFTENKKSAIHELMARFPNAQYSEGEGPYKANVLDFFRCDWTQLQEIKLHLKGTDFQLKVWELLLKIPAGHLAAYGKIAEGIHHPNATRAVGTAIGQNPVAYLIPCHRVLRASGKMGGYRWGKTRKTAMIGWEAARRSEL